MCGWYLIVYYQLGYSAARCAVHLKNQSSEPCLMHNILAQPLSQQKIDTSCPTTKHPCLSGCIFSDFQSLQGTPSQNWGAPGMGDMTEGIVFIWKYLFNIILQGYMNHLQSNYSHHGQQQSQRAAFTGHLWLGSIWVWRYPVHASDVEWPMMLFGGKPIEPIECHFQTE